LSVSRPRGDGHSRKYVGVGLLADTHEIFEEGGPRGPGYDDMDVLDWP
jgi:hypothetical protein